MEMRRVFMEVLIEVLDMVYYLYRPEALIRQRIMKKKILFIGNPME
jgi:hypothetical protein